MTENEILKLLIKKKIIKKVEEEYFLYSDLKSLEVKCKNLPTKYYGLSANQGLDLFYEECNIPRIIKAEKITYEGRTKSKAAERIFVRILADESIDFSILVDKTQQYYKVSTTVKKGMAKYFTEGTWRNVYDSDIITTIDRNNSTWL